MTPQTHKLTLWGSNPRRMSLQLPGRALYPHSHNVSYGKKGHSCLRIEMFVTVFISLLAFFLLLNSLIFFPSLLIISCLISSLDSVLGTKVDNNYYNFPDTHPNQFENFCCQYNYIEIEQSNC